MKEKYKLLLFVIIILLGLFSCRKDEVKEAAIAGEGKNKELIKEEKYFVSKDIAEEYKPVAELINEYDFERSDIKKIGILEKINMGIPGGDNWLVGWGYENPNLIIYIINNNVVINSYNVQLVLFNPKEYVSYDIMKDIPGKRLGKSSGAIWDYNEDGYEEILSLGFYGIGRIFSISGYDKEEDEVKYFCEIPFEQPGDREKGPAPVKFLTYEGQYGFQIYIKDIDTKENLWAFYYKSSKSRRFTSLHEYTPPEE